MTALLEIRALSKRFGGVTATDALDLKGTGHRRA